MSSALSRACSALAAPSAGTPLVLPPIAALLNPFPRAGGTVGGSPAPAGTLTAGWGLLRSARKDMAGLRAASQACSALAALLTSARFPLPLISALLNPFPRAGGTVGGSLRRRNGNRQLEIASLRSQRHGGAPRRLPPMLRPRCTPTSARSGEKWDRWLGEPLGRGRGHRVGAGKGWRATGSLRRPGKRCVGPALGLLRGPGASGSAPTAREYSTICADVKPPRTMRTRCRFSTIMHFASCGPRRPAGFPPPAPTL